MNKIAPDFIPLVQRHLISQLRNLVISMTDSEKIETAQLLLYQAGKHSKTSIRLLVPQNLDGKFHTVFGIAEFLSAEDLIQEATEILEKVQESLRG